VYGLEGELLGEYDLANGGQAVREYIWLQGMPVAVVGNDSSNPSPSITQMFYIHADHLNTPRVVVNRAGAMRWSWMAEPFGSNSESNNPQGLGAFSFNLRMPGQYFDAESGLNYNYFRSYDSGVGRYTQSDPIGLAGGINTYSYVGGRPTRYSDPLGLWATDAHNYFIDQMFSDLSPAIRDIIKEGSAYADKYQFQGPDFAHMHAMSSVSMSPDESRRKMCDYIKKYMGEAEDARRAGTGHYWFYLGMGLHPVMDSTSPAHEGFQPWRGVRRDAHKHGSSPMSMETKAIAMQSRHAQRTIQRMRDAMKGNFGDCGC
jgi:RHS repeat-associated protein